MSEYGAALQQCNQELVKNLEDLKDRRHKLQSSIDIVQNEKEELLKNIEKLQKRLTDVDQKLHHYINVRNSYDKTIEETESGFKKILESSQTLAKLAKVPPYKLDNDSLVQ